MKKFNLRYTGVAMSIMAMSTLAAANNAYAQEEEVKEEIVVTGTRAVIQNSIGDKRIQTQISDGLTADEIGDIPALSIGEALETITGASSHRENGGATEVSIRGLGPFLTNTVINGREATNGAGNRAVNFSQFPSELFTKIGIFKTQSAEFIEGAVGGQIRLDTKRPIDHGKQSIQLSLKGTYNEDQQNIDTGVASDIGYRGTISYIDQFETENSGTFGISIGVQRDDTSRPEGEFGTSTTFRNCALTPDGSAFVQQSGNCDGAQLVRTDPASEDAPFAFVTSNRFFRQNEQSDERDAVFLAGQWLSADERINVNIDAQFSERDQFEERHDLNFAETRRNITEVDVQDGIIQSFTHAGEIQLQTEELLRNEEYNAIGLNVEYQVNDNLQVSFDASYSNTNRFETERDLRTGVDTSTSSGDIVTTFSDLESRDTPTIVLGENANNTAGNILDLNDPLSFAEGSRLRIRDQITERENEIVALRGDFTLATEDLGIITEIKGGVRFSNLTYETFGDIDQQITGFSDQNAIDLANSECVNDDFPESDFVSNISNGGLVTNGVSGEVFDTFVTYDLDCAIDFLADQGGPVVDFDQTIDGITQASSDVDEDTFAAYLQAAYETEIAGIPVRGNFGVRLVNTTVESTGFRSGVSTVISGTQLNLNVDNANLTAVSEESSYTEILPSFTFVADLNDELLLRGGVFRGLSRPDPSSYSFGRNINTNTTVELADFGGDESAAVSSILALTGALGNPDLDPFTSWNADLALEWYPNEDTILAVGGYYKRFIGGFEQTQTQESFAFTNSAGVVSQETALVSNTTTSNETNSLYGIEVTASHAFSYLPGILGGLGAKLSYNYASSDFEFEDGLAGAGVQFNADGTSQELFGFVDPAGLFGLSRNVASAQLYWGLGAFDAQLIYKYRSQYFQQFSRDTTARVRFVDDTEVVEFRASYKINDAVKLSFEALNLTDEQRTDFRGLDNNIGQILTFGRQFFFGVKVKL